MEEYKKMKHDEIRLSTAFNMGYELKNPTLYGKRTARNIYGFNVKMHFKPGICKVVINNISKINDMVHLPEKYRNINFDYFTTECIIENRNNPDFDRRSDNQIDKLEYTFDKIQDEILQEFYDLQQEVNEYSPNDLNCCGQFCISKKIKNKKEEINII